MPGFGSSPFGHEPFGEWAWSRGVLWDLIPEVYKSYDSEGKLEAFVEALRAPFDELRHKMQHFTDLADPFYVRTQYDEVLRLKLGPVLVIQGVAEQQGTDGTVDGLFQFHSTYGRFREADEGKELKVWGSSVPGNNSSVIIVSVVDLQTVLTEPQLAADAGPLRWELCKKLPPTPDSITVEVRGGDVSDVAPGWLLNDGYADFEVIARRQFLSSGTQANLTEREAADGQITSLLQFTSLLGNFTPRDVGKFLTLAGSGRPTNNGKFEITDVDLSASPPAVTLRGFLQTDPGPLTWAVLPHAQLDLKGRAVPKGVVEQGGVDLQVGIGSDVIVAAQAKFSATITVTDIGKYLTVRGSTVGQDGVYKILAVVNETTVQVDHVFVVTETSLTWELRAKTLTGIVERRGIDLEILGVVSPGVSELVIPSAGFYPTDIGYTLVISNSLIPANNGSFLISAVVDTETIRVSAVLAVEAGPLDWALVSGDVLKVQLRATSLIQQLAPTFGLEIDTQENEARQRSFVGYVNEWCDLKGNQDCYRILGDISGFDVTVYALFAIDPSFRGSIPVGDVFRVGEVGATRSGTNGALDYDPLALRTVFTSATAYFTSADIGRSISINNAADPVNNGDYTIDVVVSTTAVRFRAGEDLNSYPDYGDGGVAWAPTIVWSVIKLYTINAPTLPSYDEINADGMAEYITATPPVGDLFGVDQYCWQDNWACFVDVTVAVVSVVTGNRYQIEVTGPADMVPDLIPSPAPAVKANAGKNQWVLVATDTAGGVTEYPLETTIQSASPTFYFDVYASPSVLPVLGAARLEYRCLTQISCSYCAASKVLAIVEAGTISNETGVAAERVLERVISRLVQESKPAHVELVPVQKVGISCSLTLSFEIDAGKEFFAPLYMPVTAYYDDVPPDDLYPGDTAAYEQLEVEPFSELWIVGI